MSLHPPLLRIAVLSTALWAGLAQAQAGDAPKTCPAASDRACIADSIVRDALAATEPAWRDQALRDVATSLTYDNRIDDAVALVSKIGNPDTQAMTIRAIGMAAALYGHATPEALTDVFAKLAKAAATINQPDANAIAYTYIAMAQAFAGMDDAAWATAAGMSNAALRHKAYGETAEIQAERGDLAAALKSIGFIDTASFRNKAYQKVSEILVKNGRMDDALKAAQAIDNPMKRTQAMQEILREQEESSRGTRADAKGATPK